MTSSEKPAVAVNQQESPTSLHKAADTLDLMQPLLDELSGAIDQKDSPEALRIAALLSQGFSIVRKNLGPGIQGFVESGGFDSLFEKK